MNDDFDFPRADRNEINMSSSDRKKHKKVFSRLGLAFLSYLIVTSIASRIAGRLIGLYAPQLFYSQDFLLILSSMIQYLIAFPVLCLCLKSIPKHEPVSTAPTGFKRILKYLTVCMLFMYVGNYISNFLMTKIEGLLGRMPENSIDSLLSSTNIWVSVLIVGLIGPLFEELIFRKLFIDRLTPYGEAVAIFLPSLVFGLFHGNLYQFFYAFLIGVVFSYIYVKTGNILHTTLLHMFINLFCGVFPTIVFSLIDYNQLMQVVSSGGLTEEYIFANFIPIMLFLIYSYGMLGMVGFGVVIFIKNIRKISLNRGKVEFPRGAAADVIFFNVGIIVLIAFSLFSIASNTFG